MTDRTTTRYPLDLRVDSVITAYPDPRDADRYGKPGAWTVTTEPVQFDSWVRVDYRDGIDTGTWVLPIEVTVTVELSDGELLAAGAQLVGTLAATTLPEMWEWEIRRDGVRGFLHHARTVDQASEDLAAWGEYLGRPQIEREDTDHGYTRMSVSAVVEGVPVEIRASFPTPADAGADAAGEQVRA
ncbi:hypothetical protein [Actinomadura rubrisoli]|uniref:Uncharacterized protein n=1 Tax=Actinomadura rubrisoli TaxID=2530368 RepID=A0A4R5AYJ7_9ACTN|nr:hypothetical protein [Actinomadura rubrisoli]TDD77705.1 hypothetical protein E1298_29695 [Actinomadura rubrisoli]